MKKLIIGILAGVLAIGFSIAGVFWLNTPKNVVARSFEKFSKEIIEREEISPILKTLNGGSVDFSLDSILKNEVHISHEYDCFKDNVISGKIYFSKNEIMLNDVNCKIDGIAISGSAGITNDLIYISEEHILKDAYGIKISSLAEDLKASIFAPDSGSKYRMDKKTYDKIIEFLERDSDSEEFKKDATKLIKKISEKIIDIINDNTVIKTENISVLINDEQTKVRQVTIEIEKENIKKIFEQVLDYFYENQEIIEFLKEYEEIIIDKFGLSINTEKHDTFEEAYEEFLKGVERDIKNTYMNLVDIRIKFTTPRTSVKILTLKYILGDDTVFSLDCGSKGIKKTDSITAKFFNSLTLTYNVTESSKNAFKSITVIENDTAEVKLLTDIDKANGKYKITYTSELSDDDSEKYEATGTYSKKGDTVNISIDKVDKKLITAHGDYDYIYTIGCHVTVDMDDTLPEAISNYKTLADMEESDVLKFIDFKKKLDKIF